MTGLSPGPTLQAGLVVHYYNHTATHVPAIVIETSEGARFSGFSMLYILDSRGPFFHWCYHAPADRREPNTWHWIEPA